MMISKEDVQVILPTYGISGKLIQKEGYSVISPYYGNSMVFRMLRKLYDKLHLPNKKIWYNKNVNTNKPYLFMFSSLITPEYIRWVRKNNPGSRIVFFFCDPANSISAINPDLIDRNACDVWTCDREDAVNYNLKLYNGGSYFRHLTVSKDPPVYDVFFIGKDKGRYDYLNELEKSIIKMGLKPYFHISADRTISFKRKEKYKKSIPYAQVVELDGKSKAILHLKEGGQKGITLRIQEALTFKKKLISNDLGLKQYDFYDPANIFLLGEDDMNRLPEFVNSPYKEIETDYFQHAYFDQMLDTVFEAEEH